MLGALSPAEVKAQMERILADALFTKSQRLGSFLRFAVQETLAGRDGGLKEYSIATQVLDRGTDFNPQGNSSGGQGRFREQRGWSGLAAVAAYGVSEVG